jgi:hypothetical protein
MHFSNMYTFGSFNGYLTCLSSHALTIPSSVLGGDGRESQTERKHMVVGSSISYLASPQLHASLLAPLLSNSNIFLSSFPLLQCPIGLFLPVHPLCLRVYLCDWNQNHRLKDIVPRKIVQCREILVLQIHNKAKTSRGVSNHTEYKENRRGNDTRHGNFLLIPLL